VCIAGVFAVPHMGLELGAPPDPSSVYAHIEFESGTPIEDIDRRTAELTQGVIGLPGVRHVETNARRESSDMTVTLDGRDGADERVRSVLTAGARNLPHAFLYLPSGPHGSGQAIEVSLMGPENLLLRSLAERTARALRGEPWVDQVVLNFKEGPPTYVFSVNHEDLSYYGLNTSEIARALRWSMYGPVVLKWFEPGSRQVDLRVRAEHTKAVDLDTIRSTGITGSTGRVVAVAQLGRFILTRPPSRIYRNDRRRAVYFTLHTPLHDTRAAVTYLQSFLRNNSLPFGYAFRIDRRIFDRLRRSQTLSILLFGAMVLVFVTLAVQTESLSSPLLVMSIVPFSLAVPIALLWARGSGLDVPVLVSLIIVSGMVVNNAILVVDTVQSRLAAVGGCGKQEIVRSMRYAVRRRTRALLLTSGTVVLGMFPFLFGTAANSELFRPLAYVLVWGTAASVAATFLVLPAVAAAAPVFVRRFPRIAE
jgi:multidrug efflux pump subunit AcrB